MCSAPDSKFSHAEDITEHGQLALREPAQPMVRIQTVSQNIPSVSVGGGGESGLNLGVHSQTFLLAPDLFW